MQRFCQQRMFFLSGLYTNFHTNLCLCFAPVVFHRRMCTSGIERRERERGCVRGCHGERAKCEFMNEILPSQQKCPLIKMLCVLRLTLFQEIRGAYLFQLRRAEVCVITSKQHQQVYTLKGSRRQIYCANPLHAIFTHTNIYIQYRALFQYKG